MDQSQQRSTLQPRMDRLQWSALIGGGGGLALCALGAFLEPAQFFRSYLLAYVFWLGLPLGCLGILMLHYLVGGTWGAIIRRVLESGTRTLPLMVLLFVPLLFGLHELYSWARPEAVAQDELLRHKSLYLNVPFFAIRLALYFVAWLVPVYFLNRWSRQQDQTPEWSAQRPIRRRLILLSGPGLLLYGLTMTFAAVDWVMSLEPHWNSSIYGILMVVGQLLGALAFAVVVTAWLADDASLSGVLSPTHVHDLGNLLLAAVLFWAYIAFCQLLIIWSGNLPEMVIWYVHRTEGGWLWIALALALFQFALPFVLLLSSDIKRHAQRLAWVAAVVLFMHLVDVFWIVMPAFYPDGIFVHWLDVAALIGVGGSWTAVFVWQLKGRALLPRYDPDLQGVMQHG
jgi:hypothetical protein